MAGSSGSLHEAPDALETGTVERHRAIVSIMEELEAIDWYDQRVDASDDPDLTAILAHNRDEEKEHAVMTLEWLRRNDEALDKHLRTYLFSEGSVLDVETGSAPGGPEAQDPGSGGQPGGSPAPSGAAGSLGIGSLKGQSL